MGVWTVGKYRCHGSGLPEQSIKTKTKSTLKAEIVFTKEMKEKIHITFKLRKKPIKPFIFTMQQTGHDSQVMCDCKGNYKRVRPCLQCGRPEKHKYCT